ncbi:MAG: YARHG domain-containing protein [Elusimicrobiota bacterium]|nr:YARHG domain-containing protein [Elusimicrobiota bacterium]
MKKILLLLFIFTVYSTVCFADDGYVSVGVGGTVKPGSDQVDIVLKQQEVLITLSTIDDGYYDVDAKFIFFNQGKSTTVVMGFPEEAQKGGITNFKTWVNDIEVKSSTTPWVKIYTDETSDRLPLNQRWWTKEVYFKSFSTTTTKVHYKANYCGDSSISGYSLFYKFGTGRYWKGNIGIAIFTLRFPEETYFRILSGMPFIYYGEDKTHLSTPVFSRKRCEMSWMLKDFEPKENDTFQIGLTIKSNMMEDIWFSLSNWLEKLDYCSPWQLRIIRNAIYAKHGRPFLNEELKIDFKDIDYKPNPNYSDKLLTQEDREWIKKIVAYEKRLKE